MAADLVRSTIRFAIELVVFIEPIFGHGSGGKKVVVLFNAQVVEVIVVAAIGVALLRCWPRRADGSRSRSPLLSPPRPPRPLRRRRGRRERSSPCSDSAPSLSRSAPLLEIDVGSVDFG